MILCWSTYEGNGARQALNIPDGCMISVIVGIVDNVSVDG